MHPVIQNRGKNFDGFPFHFFLTLIHLLILILHLEYDYAYLHSMTLFAPNWDVPNYKLSRMTVEPALKISYASYPLRIYIS